MGWALGVLCCVYLIGIVGCGGSLPRDPVPVDEKPSATIADLSTVRAMTGELDAAAQADLVQAVRDHSPEHYRINPDGARG